MADREFGWNEEDAYWQREYGTRPYASGKKYEYYRPGYRYGFESAHRYPNQNWNEVESDLKNSWDTYEYRGNSTWEQIKDAVRDAWDRVTGHHRVAAR